MERRRIIGLKLFLKFCKKKSRERFGISRSQEKKTFIGCARGLLDERERKTSLYLVESARSDKGRKGPSSWADWHLGFQFFRSVPPCVCCIRSIPILPTDSRIYSQIQIQKERKELASSTCKNISNIFLFSSCHPPEDWKWTLVNNGLLVTVRLSVCLSGYSFLSLFCLQAKGVQKWIPSYFSYLSTMRKKGNGKDRPPASLQATFKSSYTY